MSGELSLDETTKAAIKGLSNAGKEAVQALANAGAAREKANRAERRKVAAALDADAVQGAARKDKKLAADLASARKAIAEADAIGKERSSRMKKAQSEWAAGLDALTKLLD